MKIYLEFLVPTIVICMLILWRWWYKITLKRARKNYNPDNDLAKLGEDARGNGGGDKGIAKAEFSTDGLAQSEKSAVLQTTSDDLLGEDKPSTRETSSSNGEPPKPRRRFRNPFSRRTPSSTTTS